MHSWASRVYMVRHGKGMPMAEHRLCPAGGTACTGPDAEGEQGGVVGCTQWDAGYTP